MSEKVYRQYRFRRPPGATELILVRHGESEPAVRGRPFVAVDGHGDPGLAPEGIEQAERVADRLADQELDAIYVSTLRRTVQTAAPLAERTRLEPKVEPDLREVFLGDWEGGEFRARVGDGDPVALEMFVQERWDVVPGGEPQVDFSARVHGAITRIAAAHPDQRVAVFSHGGVIGEVIRLAADGARGFAFVGSDNGAISHLVVTGDRWIIRRFNDTSHLQVGFDLPADLGDETAGIEPVGTPAAPADQ